MNQTDKIRQLQSLIAQALRPLITSDYWLLEVPYYTNIGDTLIWQGELDFLRTVPYRCKGMSSYYTDIPDSIRESDVILLQGGGNFGDLYVYPQDYRMQVVRKYPNNKTIILPQTVWFENESNMQECAKMLANHANLTICARDKVSYDILKRNFKNSILLVPDMAFCIDMSKWKTCPATKSTLFLRREDQELKMSEDFERLTSSAEMTITDWPTFSENSWQKQWLVRMRNHLPMLYDWYAYTLFRPYLINSGIELISSHKKIYSTRLHAAILSVLLGKSKDYS